MNPVLVQDGLGAQRRGGLIWGGALLALTLSVLALWPSMKDSGSLDSLIEGLSPELIAAFGLADFGTPVGFLTGNLYALILPLAFCALGIMHATHLTATDEDAGRLELLFALPVGRASVYLSRFIAVALVLAVVSTAVGVTVGLGAPVFDMELDTSGVVGVTVALFLLALFHAGLAMALAGCGLRGPTVLAIAFGVLVGGYVVHAVLPIAAELADLKQTSPWYWALGGQPLADGLDAAGAGLLTAGSLLFLAVALLTISRRTIRTP